MEGHFVHCKETANAGEHVTSQFLGALPPTLTGSDQKGSSRFRVGGGDEAGVGGGGLGRKEG